MARARTSTRRRFIVGSAGLACAAAGAAAGAELLSGTSAGRLDDAGPLALALELERLQEAFYAEAVAAGGLGGELLDFAATAALHEAEHVALLTPLVPDPPPPAVYAFGAATAGPSAFARAAATIEELAVAAYNGALPGLSARGIATAARIASVDARHAAWVRAILGGDPAAGATDRGLPPARVAARLEATGFIVRPEP